MRFPWWSYVLWAINFGMESAILLTAIRRRTLPRLHFLRVLIGFTILADVVRFGLDAGRASGDAYAWAYWIAQAVEMVLRSLLAIQILAGVLRAHIPQVIMAGAYSALWLGWIFWQHFRGDPVSLLTVAIAANFITAALATAAIVIPSGDWPRGWSAVVFGLFISAILEMVLALLQRQYDLLGFQLLQVVWALSPLPGLGLWLSAAKEA